MLPATRRLARVLGRRGAFLTLLGVLWVLVGLSLVGAPPNRNPGAEHLLHELVPAWVMAALWAASGAVCLVYARRRGADQDRVGFVVACALPTAYAASFLFGFVLWVWPGPPDGYGRGLVQGLQWVATVLAILVVAGWSENPGRPTHHPDESLT